MRILLACEFYYPSVGGVQEVMRQLAEHFVARGHSVTVLTSYLPERRDRVLNGVTIVEFSVAGNMVRGISGDVDAYRHYVLHADYDVFMVKAAQQWTFDALWSVLDRMRRPIVFIPCGFSGLYDPAYKDYFEAMPEVLRKIDHLIFYASDYRDINFVRGLGLTGFSIVPNAASEREFGEPTDPAFRLRLGIPPDAFVILTVGTLTGGMKGHRALAEAFAKAPLASTSSVLILNGNTMSAATPPRPASGPAIALAHLRHSVRALRDTLSMRLRSQEVQEPLSVLVSRLNRASPSKRAMIVDLPRPDLVQAYLNSDLFVFASNIEYSPLVLFESAAAGLPFLTVPVGNAAEIVEWTGGGVVCPAPQDELGYTRVEPAVLAQHISRLALDLARRTALGRAGRQNWSAQFTWDIVSARYEEIFMQLCARRKADEGTA